MKVACVLGPTFCIYQVDEGLGGFWLAALRGYNDRRAVSAMSRSLAAMVSVL